ncbi:MAG: hypothetical protein HUJ61_00195 [Bacilli bacterium]|nr:hypothetical protein [Bacilli bacterium]
MSHVYSPTACILASRKCKIDNRDAEINYYSSDNGCGYAIVRILTNTMKGCIATHEQWAVYKNEYDDILTVVYDDEPKDAEIRYPGHDWNMCGFTHWYGDCWDKNYTGCFENMIKKLEPVIICTIEQQINHYREFYGMKKAIENLIENYNILTKGK